MKVKSEKLKVLVRIVVSILILAGSVGVFRLLLASRESPEMKPASETTVLVRTVPVEPHDGSIDMQTSGLVVPFREITMSAEVAGKITFKSDKCKAGTFVEAGTRLIEVDSEEYELEVERAEAELKQAADQLAELAQEIEGAERMVEVADSDESIQQSELDRLDGLGEVVSSSEVNQARRALLSAQNSKLSQANQLQLLRKRKSRLESGLDLAKTRLKTAKLNERRATVVAPSDGVIVSELVEQEDFVQRGAALFAFEDTSAAEVKISLRPDELQWILDSTRGKSLSADDSLAPPQPDPYSLPQLKAEIEFEYEGGRSKWSGVLSRYDGAGLDEQTRTVPCRVLVTQRMSATGEAVSRPLVRGMFVKVDLEVQPAQQLMKVPEEAVGAGDIVWCVRDGQLHRHQLNVVGVDESDNDGLRSDGQASGKMLVFSATAQSPVLSDRVVTSPLVAPLEGMRVREPGDEPVSGSEVETEDVKQAEDQPDDDAEDEVG